MPETDANGNVLKACTADDVLKDLITLSNANLLALAVSMALTSFPYDWQEQFENFKEALRDE